ncbi:MAG TPA: universal stress protein [Alphaproteobacteria bacterium]|nr:universal stress protein [Alphaproteobacteria bacterium]
MSIKRILVPLPASVDHTSEIGMALGAAKTLEAYVEALCISEPIPARANIGFAQEGYSARTAVVQSSTWLVEEREKRVQDKRQQFMQACALEGIPVVAENDPVERLPAASWREVEGEYEKRAVERAGGFDLMVATSAAVAAVLKDVAERLLLRTQRPVLLAPERFAGDLSGTAMIAWDESLQCWHAVSAAIPFLQRAQAVEVVSVGRDAASRQASQADVLAYLRCHGVSATARVVAPDSRSVGETLLATAMEAGAAMLVMGAYAHSRVREMLLGGATRHVLKNAAATPVLMAH